MKTATSETHPLEIHHVVDTRSSGGWLALTLAPGKQTQGHEVLWKRSLAADLDALVKHGATRLVPLIEDDELQMLKIPNLVAEAEKRGLVVTRFPYHDGGVPKDLGKTRAFVDTLVAAVEAGERVVVHCNGGLGRAGTIGSCVLLRMGIQSKAEDAIAFVRSRRSKRAVENAGQERFVAEFASSIEEKGSRHSVASVHERAKGAWYGLVVGDVLGAPIEFQDAEAIAKKHGIWKDVAAGGPWDKGEWTDDTALALCNAAAYRGRGFDIYATASEMVQWISSKPKDVGNLTRTALGILSRGDIAPEAAGPLASERHPGSAGNGSLMRAAATALVRAWDDVRLVEETRRLSLITHADPRCVDACVAYNVVLASLVGGASVGEALTRGTVTAVSAHPDVRAVMKRAASGEPAAYTNEVGIGFVLLCLEWALVAVRDSDSFESGLVAVVNRGGDTDTNGAVAGALLGARFGFGALPKRWLAPVLKREVIDAAHEALQRAARRDA